jgi:two-component system chemotaxis response regulator CheY
MELPEHIKNKNFLICDDYESMRTMITESLKGLGIKSITQAKSGNEGFQTILTRMTSDKPIQFVVTDLIMENGTGIELAKQIRANDLTKKLPILMVTSKAEVSYVLEGIKAGVNSYIVKPWSNDDLHKRITEVDEKMK